MDLRKYMIDDVEIYGANMSDLKPRKLKVKRESWDVNYGTAFLGFLIIVGIITYSVIVTKFPTLAEVNYLKY